MKPTEKPYVQAYVHVIAIQTFTLSASGYRRADLYAQLTEVGPIWLCSPQSSRRGHTYFQVRRSSDGLCEGQTTLRLRNLSCPVLRV